MGERELILDICNVGKRGHKGRHWNGTKRE